MRKFRNCLFVPILCMMILSGLLMQSGCSSAVEAADLMSGIEAAEWPSSPDLLSANAQSAIMDFSWKLLKASLANEGSLLISPASVYLALSMTANGSDGMTRQAMLEILGMAGQDMETLNESCRDWMTQMQQDRDALKLMIANSIWYRSGFSADEAFLQKNADYFAAGARVLDFTRPEAVDTINGWVDESTRGTIDKILEKINPAAVMYLINTLYFKADWETQFLLNSTKEGSFLAPGGPVDVQYMHQTGEMPYLEGEGVTGILLPYADGPYAFFALLTNDGISPRQFVSSAGSTWFADLLKNPGTARIELSLPRFEAQYGDSLINELEDMGMGIAFSQSQADFSLMSASRDKDLYISEIKHKTFFKINEVGTEAAAATLVEISKGLSPAGDIQFELNRPFIYGILDTDNGLPLFIGIMEDPS